MKPMTGWLFVALALALGACGTVRGFGQDMSAAGQALSNAAGRIAGHEPATATAPPEAVQGSSAPRHLTPAPRAPEQPEEAK